MHQKGEHFAADIEHRKIGIERVTKAGSRVTETKLDEFLMIHIGVIFLSWDLLFLWDEDSELM
ncbi:hypothetical protein D3C71_2233450 [compost metagenome]